MKSEYRKSSILMILAGLMVVGIAAALYIHQLNQTVTAYIMNTMEELAQHDMRSIEAFVETCWKELDGMARRFERYECETLLDVEMRMNLECATSDFSHIYLLAEDGRVFTDKYVVYDPGEDAMNREASLLPYFAQGERRIVTRWDDRTLGAGIAREYVLYGVRLDGFEVEGTPLLAIIGLSEAKNIQDRIILNSFIKNGVRRGYSAVLSMSGNYVIGANKTLYLNELENVYQILEAGSRSEMEREEIEQRMNAKETFRFHYYDADGVYKLLYFSPFEGDITWYFLMVVENEAFAERIRIFVLLTGTVMTVILAAVVFLILALTATRNRSVRAIARAKAQSDFLSNMSHEIRTPLNGLIGLNHLVLTHIDEPEEKEQIKDWLRKAHGTANYLLSLVNNILDMSKLQAGKADLVNEPMLVETLIDAVWSMQRDNIKNRGVNFDLQQEITVPCVVGDSMRIKQVLMNIVGNAAKFTPKGGTITLSVRQEPLEDGRVKTVFSCRDTGVGMSPEFVARIFDAFSQERSRNSASVKGTGLGMAISKLLIDAMGGTIRVESELNAGSVFTVELPLEIAEHMPEYLSQCTEETIAEGQEISNTLHDGKPLRVLIAEDNELNAEILIEILSEEGFEVAHAENGQRAVELFSASEPGEFGIILMDMQMPVMDGCTASRRIRALERPDAKTITIFACTANTLPEDRERAIESGMNDFLAKPIDIQAMLDKLNSSAGSAQKHSVMT